MSSKKSSLLNRKPGKYFPGFCFIVLFLCSSIAFAQKNECRDVDYPALFFVKNTTNFIKDSSEFNLQKIIQILKNNPNTVITIDAHCSSDEQNVQELSSNRAKKIYDIIANAGIEKERLVPKAFGTTKLKFTDSIISQTRSRKSKKKLRLLNRRVVFHVVSWRYKLSTVSGEVFNGSDKTSVPNVPIIIKSDDGRINATKTDKDGKYSFEIDWYKCKQVEFYPQTNKDITTATAPCGFFSTAEKHKIKYNDTTTNYIGVFELQPITCCGGSFPSVLFKKNSGELTDSIKTSIGNDGKPIFSKTTDELNYLYKTLAENPTIVIEISAHCSSDEKNAEKLSQTRAEKIKQLLISKGIDEKRLVAKGYGIKKLKITDNQIKKAKTEEEKEALHQINRRVVFKILSWDYPAKEIPKQTPEPNEDDED